MSNPQFIKSNWADFFGSNMLPMLEKIFAFNVQRHPSVRDVLFNMESVVNTDIWQYSEVHDMALLSSVTEGSDYLFKTPLQGYDKTYTMVKYGLGFSISEEAVEDQKFSFLADAVAKLAKSAKETQEQAAMDIFNNGFSSETTADGVAVFSTSHTTPTGTITVANKPSTDVDLSFSSLSTLLSNYKKAFRGDSGIYYNIRPKYLLVPAELGLYARQIVGSALEADSANNNMNPFHMQLQVIESPHLTDSDAWFLVSDKLDHSLTAAIRSPIQTQAAAANSVGFINDVMYYKCRYREALGVNNPFGLYGTSGAA